MVVFSDAAIFHRRMSLAWTLQDPEAIALLTPNELRLLAEFNAIYDSIPWIPIETHPFISDTSEDELNRLTPIATELLKSLENRGRESNLRRLWFSWWSSHSVLVALNFLGFPIFGGMAGFAGYFLAATFLDNRDTTTEPILSYGQQAVLVSLPLCTLTSAVIGLGLAFAMARKYVMSISLLLAVSLCSWAINNSYWNDQIKRYGPDPSEAVLYYPPLACSGIAILIAAIVATWSFVTRHCDKQTRAL